MTKRITNIFIFIATTYALQPTLSFTQGAIGVSAVPKLSEVMLAEPAEIVLTVRLPGAMQLDLSSWKAGKTQWGDFILWDYQIKTGQEEGLFIANIKIYVMPFKLGETELPAIEIPAKATDSPPTIIKTPPIPLKVLDPTQNTKNPTEMRDIKTPHKPLYFWENPWFFIPASLLIMASLLAFFAYWRARRKKAAEIRAQAEENIPAEDAFYRDLSKLLATNLPANLRYREFHFKLSEIFRRYLDRRFKLETESLTTSEMLRHLHSHRQDIGLHLPALVKLRESLEITDLAKFAKYAPSTQENDQAVEILKDFVQDHRRRQEKEAGPVNAAKANT